MLRSTQGVVIYQKIEEKAAEQEESEMEKMSTGRVLPKDMLK